MSNEIELKFQINQSYIEQLQNYLNQWVCCDEAEFSSQQHLVNQLNLTNTYYDTEDHFLRLNGCGLRIRTTETEQSKCFEITLKSKGNSIGGLHERIEINQPLPNDKLDLSVLPKEALPNGLTQLRPLFTTNFKRQTWLISFASSEIEVALDLGLITSNGQSMPIQEVELEIKQGNKQDLLNFAIELSRFNLHLFSQSKASRGYRLLDNLTLTPTVHSSQIEQDLAVLLNFWQQNEEYALANNDLIFYKQLLIQINEILINKNLQIEPDFKQWQMAIPFIDSIKQFAYCEVNTKFKLMLMAEINKK
ncbi:inorganic triphosphatase [Gilliamella apis]|uniref:CYTH domain-containing protein n=1 Tax=Gilliamella apis TaxID=1970738 RepID=UPI00242DD5DC|nr:CYTH domain-containing protein [Gilliamella apis]